MTPNEAIQINTQIQANATSLQSLVNSLVVAPVQPPASNAQLIGVNCSGSEYSFGAFPGPQSITYLKSRVRLIRLPIAWEMIQPVLNGPLDPTYLANLQKTIRAFQAAGMAVLVDLHNYARYNPNWETSGNVGPQNDPTIDVIGGSVVSVADFVTVWKQLAFALQSYGLWGYGLMNEPHDMSPGGLSWLTIAQYGINAIRGYDTTTPITVQSDVWGSAQWWPSNGATMYQLSDPTNKLIFEAHCYFDSDGSGQYKQTYSAQGATPSIGVDRLRPFVQWCQQRKVTGFIGEFGCPGNDPNWLTVLKNALDYMRASNIGGTYWQYGAQEPGMPAWFPNQDPASPDVQMNLAPFRNSAGSVTQEKAQWGVLANYL